jgi:hypothetical protein
MQTKWLRSQLAYQQALEDHPTGNHVLSLPNGVYDISDVLLQRRKQARDRIVFSGNRSRRCSTLDEPSPPRHLW